MGSGRLPDARLSLPLFLRSPRLLLLLAELAVVRFSWYAPQQPTVRQLCLCVGQCVVPPLEWRRECSRWGEVGWTPEIAKARSKAACLSVWVFWIAVGDDGGCWEVLGAVSWRGEVVIQIPIVYQAVRQ